MAAAPIPPRGNLVAAAVLEAEGVTGGRHSEEAEGGDFRPEAVVEKGVAAADSHPEEVAADLIVEEAVVADLIGEEVGAEADSAVVTQVLREKTSAKKRITKKKKT